MYASCALFFSFKQFVQYWNTIRIFFRLVTLFLSPLCVFLYFPLLSLCPSFWLTVKYLFHLLLLFSNWKLSFNIHFLHSRCISLFLSLSPDVSVVIFHTNLDFDFFFLSFPSNKSFSNISFLTSFKKTAKRQGKTHTYETKAKPSVQWFSNYEPARGNLTADLYRR